MWKMQGNPLFTTARYSTSSLTWCQPTIPTPTSTEMRRPAPRSTSELAEETAADARRDAEDVADVGGWEQMEDLHGFQMLAMMISTKIDGEAHQKDEQGICSTRAGWITYQSSWEAAADGRQDLEDGAVVGGWEPTEVNRRWMRAMMRRERD